MAETEAESVPNGTGGLSAEEDDERLKQRPADIDADVREMERRKRVEAIMSSKLFREELERVLDQQLSEGGGGGAAPLLQRIREMVGGAGAARLQAGAFKGGNCVLPINDIRGIEGMGYEKGEKILRCKLAAVYRLVDLYGWTQAGVSGQITARLNTAVEHFLTAPRGLLPHEVTASSLVKLDMQGAVQDHGTTNFPVNLAGFSLHACVHAARPDVRCVLHVRSPAALAVSAQRDGLLPLCSEAALLGDLAYHHLPPGALDNEERDKLVRALGPTAKILVLTNGGALCCGETLEEAFYQAKCLTAACDVQLRLASVPVDKLNLLDDDTRKQLYDASRRAPADGVKWRVGGEEFEALMRMLDNAGYRTGYIYRHPLVKGDVPKPRSDVEVPPAVSSLGYLLEEEELYRQGLWKKIDGRKTGDRTRWLNSPNVYQKVEVLETGTNDPKKITKWVDANTDEWVQDGSPAHSSTPVKIDAALQFVPKNTNPKEFKQLQQQIKDNRRADKISAGPQSHILEGVTWDEANKLNAEDAAATHTGDHVVLMGAASKGIIQRGYQHNATVYSAPYARNPFDQVSDRDLDEYKRTVERKARGEYDADVSESEGVSAAQLTSPDCQPSETEEEPRDDHRILRIETKQAPRPSQPEVVLSDDSTSEFLANERRAAERTPRGESALLSDDDVFLAAAAPLAGGAAAPAAAAAEAGAAPPVRVGGGVLADGSLLVRSYNAPVQQNIVKGEVQEITKHVSSSHSHANSNQVLPVPSNHDSLNQVIPQDHCTNQRLRRRYSRSCNFESVVKIFESPEKQSDQSSSLRHPHRSRSRTSSNHLFSENAVNNIEPPSEDMIMSNRLFYENFNIDSLDLGFQALSTDISSVYSSWSNEWDTGRRNHDCWLRTRSLPRSKTGHKQRTLFRTRSHSGFVNGSDVEPKHFHLPRCKSCDAYNVNYAWEVEGRRFTRTSDFEDTLCLAVDIGKDKTNQSEGSENMVYIPKNSGINDGDKDIPKDRLTNNYDKGEASLVKVKMANVPVLRNALKMNFADVTSDGQEFVYSQEFDDECYLDSGGSFSSGNQTVIEKVTENEKQDAVDETLSEEKEDTSPNNVLKDKLEKEITETSDSIEAEFDSASDRTDEDFTQDTVCGDYINFSDYEDNIYESPVKDLVLKDIRNYSVPITVYCDDFTKYVQAKGPKRSPTKAKPLTLPTILEPILEESKSSYGDESAASAKESGPSVSNHDTHEECVKEVLLETIEGRAETIFDIVTIVDDIVMDSVAVAKKNMNLLANEASKINENIEETCITTNEASTCDGNTVGVATEDTSEEYYCIEELSMNSANVCSPIREYEKGITHEKKITTAIVEEMEYSANEQIFKVPKRPESNRSSSVASSSVRGSFDSTGEFERIETVSEVLGSLLDRASMENKLCEVLNKENQEFLGIVSRRQAKAVKQLVIYEEIHDEIHVEETVEIPEEKEIIENKNPDSETKVQETDLNDDTNNDFGVEGGIANEYLNKNVEELESAENTILEISAVRSSEYLKTDTSYLGAIGLASSTFGESQYLFDNKNVFDNENYMLAEEFSHTSEHNLKENESLTDSLECMNDFLEQNKCNADFGSTFSLSKAQNIEHISFQVNSDESEKDLNTAFDNEGCNIFSDCENNNEIEIVQNVLQMAKEFKKYVTADENGNYASEVVEYILEIIMNGSTAHHENNASADLSNVVGLDLNVSQICDIDPNALDTAFVESSYLESITSSPIGEATSKIVEFDESPIKNLSRNLYEREDSILGSPFIKNAPVITMSHTEQKGGVKFWISFDDNLSETFDRPLCRRVPNIDDKTPSFLLAEFAENPNKSRQLDSRESTISISKSGNEFDRNNMNGSCDMNKSEFFEQVQSRKSVLCQSILETNKSVDEPEGILNVKFGEGHDSFETAATLSNPGSSTFSTCDSTPIRDVALLASDLENVDYLVETAGREKVRKVYDSSKRGQLRRGSSWPPYEDTLFYKIVSKFRMSESFDPNEFEKLSP